VRRARMHMTLNNLSGDVFLFDQDVSSKSQAD
jgi:hypothetical protein